MNFLPDSNQHVSPDFTWFGWPYPFHETFTGKVMNLDTHTIDKSSDVQRDTFILSGFLLDLLLLIVLIIGANVIFASYKNYKQSKL